MAISLWIGSVLPKLSNHPMVLLGSNSLRLKHQCKIMRHFFCTYDIQRSLSLFCIFLSIFLHDSGDAYLEVCATARGCACHMIWWITLSNGNLISPTCSLFFYNFETNMTNHHLWKWLTLAQKSNKSEYLENSLLRYITQLLQIAIDKCSKSVGILSHEPCGEKVCQINM